MAVYEIVGHELSANQWGTSIVLHLSNYYSPYYDIDAYYLQNGTWKEATSGRAFYENFYTFNIPTDYYDDNITVRIRETHTNTGQSTYTSSYTLSIKPKIIGHEIDNLNNEILLLLDGDYSGEFIAMAAIRDYNGDLIHITDNAPMSYKGITVDYPNNAGTMLTFETRLVHKEFNYIFDMDNYSFVITDRIQYNQSGTIRNMEAKYNHNGVIKNVECWYNHNGVLKKIQ